MSNDTLHRRDFLGSSAVLALIGSKGVAADAKLTPIIDTHTHFYDPTRPQGVPWPGKDSKTLYRRVLPAEFRKLTQPFGVTGTVVVEASPWVEDNQWLLDVAKNEPLLVGVVGRLLTSDEEFATNLKRFARNPAFRGIRINHGEVKSALADKRELDLLRLLGDNGLTLDVNGGPDLLPDVATLAEVLPKLTIVVNHMGNVPVDGREPPTAWKDGLKAAARENVRCKLSALVDGTRKRDVLAPTDLGFYRPVLDVLWAAFGESRLMFGSNWPVSDLYAGYGTVWKLASEYVKTKGQTAFDKVFGLNAQEAYRLPKR